MITAAVLTISDSVSAGRRADRSGPAVRERLEQLGWKVAVMETIADETEEIGVRLATLADGGQVAAIFTTGGTGVAPGMSRRRPPAPSWTAKYRALAS